MNFESLAMTVVQHIKKTHLKYRLGTAILLLAFGVYSPALADGRTDMGRITAMEENDKFSSHDDRHYTQGIRLTYLSPSVTPKSGWNQPYDWLSGMLPIFRGADAKRKYEATFGQSIFSPTNTSSEGLSRKDRPYAAWLYTGTSLLQETKLTNHHTLENMELLIGVVGPPALGDLTQNSFHQFIGVSSALGWKNQIHTEPGLIATYERKWRFQKPLIGNLAIDAIPEIGASAGNIMTYGEAGGIIRLGQNLAADYGPNRIRPSLSGTSWFDAEQLNGNLGWYIFLGTQGRVIAQNIFLDGNTFTHSPHVGKKPLVADFIGGASLFWSEAIRVDFTVTQRTKEFYGQQGHPDRFGGINITFHL